MLDPFPLFDDTTTSTDPDIATGSMAGLANPLAHTSQALLAEIGLPIHVVRDLLPSEVGSSA